MFKCQNCNKTSKPRTRQNKVTIETRPKNYYNIVIRHKTIKKPRFKQYERKDYKILDDLKNKGWKVVHESFSKGREIVKEKNICEECNDKQKN